MAVIVKRKLEARKDYVEFKSLKAGDVVVIGKLINKEMVSGHPSFSDPNKLLPKYTFEDLDTKEHVVVNSATKLDWIMKDVEIGTLLQIIFLGRQSFVSKGKMGSGFAFDVQELEYEPEEVQSDEEKDMQKP